MHPEFYQRELDGKLRSEVLKCMRELSKMPGAPDYNDIKSEYIAFQEAIKLKKVCVFTRTHFVPFCLISSRFVYVHCSQFKCSNLFPASLS